ncbi:Uncharacterized protein FWK35_00001104 [Aphis craccivora]|uniref:Uncharacterized protein n=1 Tax=Aphis craccivora TaxID=307492 RepID=A0A6G0ZP26_APHCR|nr:Uncharacterized protein FWK35_00001104 [Aphis craccivora]
MQHLPKWATGLRKLHFCRTESLSGATRLLRSLRHLKTKISPDLLCKTTLGRPKNCYRRCAWQTNSITRMRINVKSLTLKGFNF